MRKYASALCLSLTAMVTLPVQAQSPSQAHGVVVQGKMYKIERIADGIYSFFSGVGSNNIAIVNDNDVVLVDTAITPERTRLLLADLKLITDKPVRTVIDTHWHYDHSDGNQVFGPDVEIIAQDAVYTALTTRDVLHTEPFKSSQPYYREEVVDELRRQADQAPDASSRDALNAKLRVALESHGQLQELRPTPPTLTFSTSLTLHRGTREIDLLFLGRGHTAGDIVVYLPREKLVCTGDFMEPGPAGLGDSYPDEWIKSLDRLKAMKWVIDIPGHGAPFSDKARVAMFQSYLADLAAQITALHAQGMTAEEAAAKVDLTLHAKDYPRIKGSGISARDARGLYDWLEKRR